jgi:hypothetical protein
MVIARVLKAACWMWIGVGATTDHVTLKLHARDVRACAILLCSQCAVMDAVIKLRPTHAKNVSGLDDLET